GELRIRIVAARKRRDFGRKLEQERRLDELALGNCLEQRELQRSPTLVRFVRNAERIELAREESAIAQVGGAAVGVAVAADRLRNRQARERLAEIERLALVRHAQAAERGLRGVPHERFGVADHVLAVL